MTSTFARDPTGSRTFDPEGWGSGLGGLGGDSDSEEWDDQTVLPCGQPCRSLMDSRRERSLYPPQVGYNLSLNLTQSTDRPKHTNPVCKHCPGLRPGYHYCKESGRAVKSCEDCEISHWKPADQLPPVPNPPVSAPPEKPRFPCLGATLETLEVIPEQHGRPHW